MISEESLGRDGKKTSGLPLKKNYWDFLGGPVVKNPSPNARDMGLILDWGTKMPHAARNLKPVPACHTKNPHAATKTQCRQNNNKKKQKL